MSNLAAITVIRKLETVITLKESSTFYFQMVENRLSSMRLIRMDLNRKLDMKAKQIRVEDIALADRMVTTTVILLVDRIAKVAALQITRDLMEAVLMDIQTVVLARESPMDLMEAATVINQESQVR